jgi:hypothetical protein
MQNDADSIDACMRTAERTCFGHKKKKKEQLPLCAEEEGRRHLQGWNQRIRVLLW